MKTYHTAKAIFQDGNGDILLLRRSATHPTQGLNMDLPGGIVEGNELPAQTLIREIKEETGIGVAEKDLKLVFALTEENKRRSAVRLVYFVAIPGIKSNVNLSWEHDHYIWLSMSEAIKKLKKGSYKQKSLQYVKENNILRDS
jgi:8-oxo-dGTP pyrophosphatase MutT (NUDIX family)